MIPAPCADQASVLPPSYQLAAATALHLDGLTLATRLHLLEVSRAAVRIAQQQLWEREWRGATPLAWYTGGYG